MRKRTQSMAQVDMLNGSLWDKIPLFALPVALTSILGQLFNAADVAIVGTFSGDAATASVAAVGANAPVIGLVVGLFVGISLGAGVVISNAIGQGNIAAGQTAVHTSVMVSLMGGISMTILGELLSEFIMNLMGIPADVYAPTLLYLRIYFLGIPFILLYNFEAAIFRSVGEARLPLMVLAGSGILNVVLNFILVALFHMTVDGVAIATVVSNAVSAGILFRKLCTSPNPYIRLQPEHLTISSACLRRILWIGLPAGIQGAVFSLANIVIQSAINSLGTAAMAASGAAQNIEMITFNLQSAFGQACATFVGQNYGAGNLKRCRKVLKLCILEGFCTLGVTVTVIFLLGRPLLAIFDSNPEVISLGYLRLQFIVSAHFACMVYEVLSGYLRGFGFSAGPAALTIAGVCGVRLAWVYTVFSQHPTFPVLMAAYPISLTFTALLMIGATLYYRPSKRFQSGA